MHVLVLLTPLSFRSKPLFCLEGGGWRWSRLTLSTASKIYWDICVVLLWLTLERLVRPRVSFVPLLLYQNTGHWVDMSRTDLFKGLWRPIASTTISFRIFLSALRPASVIAAASEDTLEAKYRHAASIRLIQKRSWVTVPFPATSCSIINDREGCFAVEACRWAILSNLVWLVSRRLMARCLFWCITVVLARPWMVSMSPVTGAFQLKFKDFGTTSQPWWLQLTKK